MGGWKIQCLPQLMDIPVDVLDDPAGGIQIPLGDVAQDLLHKKTGGLLQPGQGRLGGRQQADGMKPAVPGGDAGLQKPFFFQGNQGLADPPLGKSKPRA